MAEDAQVAPALKLTGRQKAAIFMIFLGPELSSSIFQTFTEEEMEIVTIEIAKQKKVTPELKHAVLLEFEELMMAREFLAQGGLEYAKELLEKSVGPVKALDLLSKMGTSLQVRPFESARTSDPKQLISFIQNEHPQTISLILAYLQPDKAAEVLSQINAELQTDIAKRLALMDRTSPEIIREVENVLDRKLAALMTQDFTTVGGIESLVQVLNFVDRSTEKTILETLEIQDPELAEAIKKQLLVFEDIVLIDNRGIQKIIKQVDPKELTNALKGATDDVKEKFLSNMSVRAAKMIRDDMLYMGPVRIKDVEEAQQKIVNVIKQLEDEGEVVITRAGEEEFIE
ncbi:flagellar motor switch protein FliG [Candidatus Riflebacteria bacterium]